MELEWEEFHCLEKMNRRDALEYLDSIKEDGWRLPTVEELIFACKNYVEGFQKWGYWSSEIHDKDYSIIVYFYTSNQWVTQNDSQMYVRFIRDIE